MRKRISILSILLLFLLAGCSQLSQEEETTLPEGIQSPLQNEQSEDEMQVILQQLVNNNSFVRQIFMVSSLSMDEKAPVAGTENSFYVNDSRFTTYAALTQFLNDTYVDITASELLHMHPANADKPLYFDQDGRLCVNKNLVQNGPAETGWSGYTIKLERSTAASCHFQVLLPNYQTVTAATGETQAKQTAYIAMTAVRDSGDSKWKLERVYSLEDVTV